MNQLRYHAERVCCFEQCALQPKWLAEVRRLTPNQQASHVYCDLHSSLNPFPKEIDSPTVAITLTFQLPIARNVEYPDLFDLSTDEQVK